MIYNKLDSEYYVMNVDGANNHPILAWGATDYDAFLEAEPIDEKTLDLPLKIVFDTPYPKNPEMADILSIDGNFAMSEKIKLLFERMNIYDVQFFPVEIETNKKKTILRYYAFHSYNGIWAIDKNNYVGDEVDEDGMITNLEKFHLDAKVLESIPLEKKLIFHLAESYVKETVVHQSVKDAIVAENLTGFSFFKVSKWDEDAMFR